MKTIYSIWHSTKSIEEFMFELHSVNFDFLVDVRSKPYSRFVPQYNKNRLEDLLADKYIFMWDTLWWMDEEITFEQFSFWIEQLSSLAKDHVVVFFCSEKNHFKCHRFWKLTPELELRNFKIIHL